MQTWEYKSETIRREDFDATLAQRASEGWEFVAFAPEEMAGSAVPLMSDLSVRRNRLVFPRVPDAVKE